MDIIKQSSPNECGVCVLTSLASFFNLKNVDKITLLNESNVIEQGLSLFDFENLAQKIGISTEIYELEWSEFIAYKTNDFIVLPIQIDSGLHYVIVKKNKKFFTIYDSRYDLPLNQTYEEFSKHFAKIMIVVHKTTSTFKFDRLSKIDLFKNIKPIFLMISILMQIAIITLTTFSANYLNLIINDSISNDSFKNGLIITFVFVLMFLLNGLVKYLFKLFCLSKFKECFLSLSSNLINSLNNKKYTFVNKVEKNNFYLIDSAMQSISNFLTYEISTFCSNIFLTIVLLIIVACINPYFLIISIISICVVIVIGTIQYNFKKKILSSAIVNQNINNDICRNYIDYFSLQKSNFLIRQKINNDLKNNYLHFMKLYSNKTKFENISFLIEDFMFSIIYFLTILVSTFLIINNKNMDIGKLTFLIAILAMSHNSIDGICNFIIKKVEFKTMSEIYESFIRVENEKNEGILINEINSLAIKTNEDVCEITNGEVVSNNLKNVIRGEEVNNHALIVNNILINNINKNHWNNKLFYLNNHTSIEPKWLIEKLSDKKDVVIEGLKLFQINLVSNVSYSLKQQILLNLLYLPYLENKLIFIEDILSVLTKQQLQWIYKHLIPYVKQKNFVLISNSQ